MNINRRALIIATATAAALAASSASAQPKALKKVDVVKVISFTCAVSAASESIDPAIRAAVEATGGQLVLAPVPTEEEAVSGAKERVYYAARDLNAKMGDEVRKSLFKGGQEMGVPLNEYLQVYTWLATDMPSIEPQLHGLFQKAQEPNAAGALSRAARIGAQAGAGALPGYVLIMNGQIISLVDPDSVQGGSMLKLRDEVVTQIQKLSEL